MSTTRIERNKIKRSTLIHYFFDKGLAEDISQDVLYSDIKWRPTWATEDYTIGTEKESQVLFHRGIYLCQESLKCLSIRLPSSVQIRDIFS